MATRLSPAQQSLRPRPLVCVKMTSSETRFMGTEEPVEVEEEKEADESESKPLIIGEDDDQQEVEEKGKLSHYCTAYGRYPCPNS